jgi:hypothetical protein
MELILFSFFAAIGIVLVFTRTLGLRRTLKIRKPLDVVTTFGLPVIFAGTFAGMITAFFTGLWITLITSVLQLFACTPKWARSKLYHDEETSNANNVSGNRPSRPRRNKVRPHKIYVQGSKRC